MRRRCDGQDPNLVMFVDPATGEKLGAKRISRVSEEKPCDCGLVFDDARRFTIWPHEVL